MPDKDEATRKLEHKLANVEQEKRALQHFLDKASDEIENLIEADCETQAKDEALKAAKRFRRAAST